MFWEGRLVKLLILPLHRRILVKSNLFVQCVVARRGTLKLATLFHPPLFLLRSRKAHIWIIALLLGHRIYSVLIVVRGCCFLSRC